jgi:hypothetical protein
MTGRPIVTLSPVQHRAAQRQLESILRKHGARMTAACGRKVLRAVQRLRVQREDAPPAPDQKAERSGQERAAVKTGRLRAPPQKTKSRPGGGGPATSVDHDSNGTAETTKPVRAAQHMSAQTPDPLEAGTIDDRAWFARHVGRNYRIRKPIGGERKTIPLRPGFERHVLVRQAAPGQRLRMPLWWRRGEPLLNSEAWGEQLFWSAIEGAHVTIFARERTV